MQEETFANWNGFFLHKLVSALKRVEYVTNRVQYIVLRGHRYNIVVFNIHAAMRIEAMIRKTVFMRN